MKALITGSSGFYGTHLKSELRENGYSVICCDLEAKNGTEAVDILNAKMVFDIISRHNPDILINMAGQANVGFSWSNPRFTFELNTIGVINILEAIKRVNPKMRVITIGSSDEYGILMDKGLGVSEETEVKPTTPYAISKLAQEQFSMLYNNSFGMNICMVRQFNMGGPGQSRGFIISDFASEIAEIECGRRSYLSVGNMDSARDFTHVKDACRAIRLIAEKGKAGEIYNICSGIAHRAKEVLDGLIEMSTVPISVRFDPARMRPSDTPVIYGNHAKLTSHTGWKPQRSFESILQDSLQYWREEVSKK